MKTPGIHADERLAAIDALLDHALEETFPASDPTAVMVETATVATGEDRSRRVDRTSDRSV